LVQSYIGFHGDEPNHCLKQYELQAALKNIFQLKNRDAIFPPKSAVQILKVGGQSSNHVERWFEINPKLQNEQRCFSKVEFQLLCVKIVLKSMQQKSQNFRKIEKSLFSRSTQQPDDQDRQSKTV
jgi:hypothetical protein